MRRNQQPEPSHHERLLKKLCSSELEDVREALRNGVPPDYGEGSALQLAVMWKRYAILETLLAHGADPALDDGYLVHLAAENADETALDMLLARMDQGQVARAIQVVEEGTWSPHDVRLIKDQVRASRQRLIAAAVDSPDGVNRSWGQDSPSAGGLGL